MSIGPALASDDPTVTQQSGPTTQRTAPLVAVNDLPDTGTVTVDLPTPGRVLAVGAHPDDIEFGCGGTLAKWAAAGCIVHFLVLTDGSKGTWDPDRDQAALVAARQDEQREAAARLGGAAVGFLGRPDGELRNAVGEQREVCRSIRSVRPDVVLGHDPWRRYRLHPDHRNAGFLLTDSIVAARDPLFFSDQDLAPHRPDALLLWEADVPNHVENVASHVDAKVHALLAHRSQFETTLGISSSAPSSSPVTTAANDDIMSFSNRIRRQLSEHGALGGMEFGEAFHLMKEI
jgi:LmbE family N-acetylglucosaminyl deacetylase